MSDRVLLEQQIKSQGDLVRQLKSAKESKDRVNPGNGLLPFPINLLVSEKILLFLDNYLLTRSYIWGYAPSAADAALVQLNFKLESKNYNYENVKRWRKHIESYSLQERQKFVVCPFESIQSLIHSLLDLQI